MATTALIDQRTSIQSWPKNKTWSFQPSSPGLIPNPQGTDVNLRKRLPDATVATTTALATNTYSNGSSGVGATLTATSNGALTIDGRAMAAGDTVLVKDEAAAANNGLYTVTSAGSAGSTYVLTRHTAADATADFVGYIFVVTGTANASKIFLMPVTAITVGTTAVVFTQYLNRWNTSPLPPGISLNIASGLISGAGTVEGTSTVVVQLSTDTGPTTTWSPSTLTFPIRIKPSGISTHSGVDVEIQLDQMAAVKLSAPLVVKEGDTKLFHIRMTTGGVALDLDLTNLQIAFKVDATEPDPLVTGGGDPAVTPRPAVLKQGTGEDTVWIVSMTFDGDGLSAALDERERPKGTFVAGFLEITWTETNALVVGPTSVTGTSQNFPGTVFRDLIDN